MKKTLFLCMTLVSCLSTAAITSWGGGVATSGRDNYQNGGYAYLISVTQDGPTLQEMITYIQTSGLVKPDSSNVTVQASAEISSGMFYVSEGLNVPSLENLTYYTLFVDSSKENFFFSAGATLDNRDYFSPPAGPPGTEPQYGATFDEYGQDWSMNGGAIAGDEPIDPDVPEPTALALLALGVAGVALRRRIR